MNDSAGKKRGIDYAEPSVPQPLPPAWQRSVAWTMLGIAVALILYILYVFTADLRQVLFMPH
jgi:hypothetical protein